MEDLDIGMSAPDLIFIIGREAKILLIDLVLRLYEIDIGITDKGGYDKACFCGIDLAELTLIRALSERDNITGVIYRISNHAAEQHCQRTHLDDQQHCHDNRDRA